MLPKVAFIASAVYAKIIALSYIKICPVKMAKNGQKCCPQPGFEPATCRQQKK